MTEILDDLWGVHKGGLGSGRHKVKIGFNYGGKRFDHEFDDIKAQSKEHAIRKVVKEIEKRIGRVELQSAHAETGHFSYKEL